MDAAGADHVAARPRRRPRHRRRGAHRIPMPIISEEGLIDVPTTHEEASDERPPSPHSAPVPTFEYGITMTDPAAVWALFQTVSLQHDMITTLFEHAGLPRPPSHPFRLGSGPGPSRPPWSFFPSADPPADPAAGPSTGSATAAATVARPASPSGPSEQIMAMLEAYSSTAPTLGDEIVGQAMAALDFSIPSPTSVFDGDIEDGFDPDTDDLLDDF